MEIIGRVILTGSDGRIGEIARRSLEVHGLNVSVFEGPDAHRDTPGFLRELHKYIAACRAEAGGAGPEPIVLLPVFFPEVLAEHRDEFPECIIPLDTAEKIRLLDNAIGLRVA